MKICVVIQSEAFRTSAGMRIRYDRFNRSLAATENSIEVLTLSEVAASKSLQHDVYVFCKTFDTAALLLARKIKASGKVVGQDVFDDYFSQHSDQRLQRFRDWMTDMAPVTDYVVCSTKRMVEVLSAYMPDIRITAIEDPVPEFDPPRVARLADEKAERARSSKSLEIVWFGIGDNPYFPVGLTDLANCEPQFAEIVRSGWEVNLKVVTNSRPFAGGGAEVLRRLSVGYELIEWSEEAEASALARAPASVIPVNGQSFSRAKSMNRAVTALTSGCQVLSLGFPLYEQLEEFIYRSPADMLSDLALGRPRLSSRTMPAFANRVEEIANPQQAALRFVEEARLAFSDPPKPHKKDSLLCLVHGRTSGIALHKAVGAIDGLSVGTIYAKDPWNFPVRFDHLGREIVMRTTPALAAKYALPVRDGAEAKRILGLDFVVIDTAVLRVPPLHVEVADPKHPILGLAVYADVMGFARDCCRAAFPDAEVLWADTSPFAVRPPAADPGKGSTRGPNLDAARPLGLGTAIEPIKKIRRIRKLGLFAGSERDERRRALRLIQESELFDADWYVQRYPDVKASGTDPARHYLEFGWQEGRDPSRAFATRKYLKLHKDVAEKGINPLVHYIEHGEAEGRIAPRASGSTAVS